MNIWENITNMWRKRNIDNYLYEIIEDYQDAAAEERDAIFRSFCSLIWSSANKRRTMPKHIRFRVKKELRDTDPGRVFAAWSTITYTGCQSMTRQTDWCSLIRQKINNLYTRYFDRDVILSGDYLKLLHVPKQLYYQWLDGEEMNASELNRKITDAMEAADQLRAVCQNEKMELSWNAYKKTIELMLQQILTRCRRMEDYEDTHSCSRIYDFMTEDNFYIRYICQSLEYEMLKWQKQYYGVRDHRKYRRCADCGGLFELKTYNQHRCPGCQQAFTRRSKTQKQRRYRVEKLKI